MALLTDCLHWESSSFCDLPAVARLEHGIWGDGRSTVKGNSNPNYTWKTFEDLLKKQGYETIKAVDYSAENANSFDDPAIQEKLETSIKEALGTIDSQNFAGQKVDIVAHSMGGLVVRSFCEKEKDFCKESIRKLITIDTPHQGSELADLLLIFDKQPKKFSPGPCSDGFYIFINGIKLLGKVIFSPHPIDSGGVAALAVGKVPAGLEKGATAPPVGKWNGLSWPDPPTITRSVVGNASEYQNDIKKLWDQALTKCGFTRGSVFSAEGDDGIVGVPSQMGGLNGQVFNEDHFSVLESEEVVKEVWKLLE